MPRIVTTSSQEGTRTPALQALTRTQKLLVCTDSSDNTTLPAIKEVTEQSDSLLAIDEDPLSPTVSVQTSDDEDNATDSVGWARIKERYEVTTIGGVHYSALTIQDIEAEHVHS